MKNYHGNESTNDDIYLFKLKLANFLFYLKQVYVEIHRHSRRHNQPRKEMVHYSMRWRYNTTLYKLPPFVSITSTLNGDTNWYHCQPITENHYI